MLRRPLVFPVLIASLFITSALRAQSASPILKAAGDVATPLAITLDEFRKLPRTKVEIKEEGRTVVYEGVLVGELLKRAGAPVGSAMRGDAVATYVAATASDGYRVVFSLAELDPEFTGSTV